MSQAWNPPRLPFFSPFPPEHGCQNPSSVFYLQKEHQAIYKEEVCILHSCGGWKGWEHDAHIWRGCCVESQQDTGHRVVTQSKQLVQAFLLVPIMPLLPKRAALRAPTNPNYFPKPLPHQIHFAVELNCQSTTLRGNIQTTASDKHLNLRQSSFKYCMEHIFYTKNYSRFFLSEIQI